MTAEASECNGRREGSKVEFEMKRGGDLKDNGIACRDGEEIGGSFVIVNGDSDDLEGKLDPMTKSENGELKSENGEIGGKEEYLEDDEKFSEENGGNDERFGEEKEEKDGDLVGKKVIGSGSEIGFGSKLDSDAQIERQDEGDVGSKSGSDVKIEHEEEETVDDKDLGVEAEEKEVFPREERERDAEAVIVESDSKVELGSEVEKEDVTEPETAVTEIDWLSESASRVEDEQKPASLVVEPSDGGDVGLINVDESHKPVDVVGETENVAEIESAVEAELDQQHHTVIETENVAEIESAVEEELNQQPQTVIEETENVTEIESAIEAEQKQEPSTLIEETEIEAELKQEPGTLIEETEIEAELKQEPGTLVEETEIVAELESAIEAELKQEPATVIEESENVAEIEPTVEVELNQQPHTVIEETENVAELVSAVAVELKQEPDTVVEEMDKAEVEEDKEPSVVVEENKSQAEIGSAVEVEPGHEPETVSEAADKIEVEERKEPEDVVAAEISSDSLKGELNGEARNIPLENSENPCMSHVAEKELVEEVCHSTDDKHVELEVSNGDTVLSEPKTDISSEDIKPRSSGLVSGVDLEPQAEELCPNKDSKVETKDSVEDVETDNDVAVDGFQLESESGNESAEGIECMVSSIEGDRSANKDDDEEPSHEQAQAAEMIQAPSETHVVKRHQVFMIKVPRFIDDELQKKIQHAMEIVEEKTKIRNSIGEEARKQAVIVNKYSLDYKAELAKERAARAICNAKRKEVEAVQELISRINNANSIADIDEKIRNMIHRQQHETISLKQEKQYIHDINQMKRLREQLSSKKAPQEQIDETLNKRDEIEARFKNLKKELDSQRAAMSSAESSTKSAWNKYIDEEQCLANLKEKHNAADGVRQEAYLHWRKLRNQSAEKAKHFKMYKADQSAATNYIFAGDNQGLRSHCSRQVERIMDLWNNNTEFREQYVKSNIYSTLRRLGTSDGRSLGPGEEAPVLRSHVDKSSNIISVLSSNIETAAPVSVSDVRQGNLTEPSATKRVVRTNQSAKLKSSTKPSLVEGSMPAVSDSEESKEEEKVNKLKREEEELARTAEELARKEEELRKEKAAKEEELRKEKAAAELKAAELKKQLRLDQKAKAKEAEERKRRKAEKAQAKAEYRAQKEAELKEKKKAKKEKKSGIADTSNGGTEGRSTPALDTNPAETSQEPEASSVVSSRKRSARSASLMKQYNKVQPPLPLPLRSKGKRKMTTWMWALLVVLLVLVLFLAGNYISFSTVGMPVFSF